MNGICYIVGAAPYTPDSPDARLPIVRQTGDLVIAADGGSDRLTSSGITADLAIGDFDSAEQTPVAGEIKRYPSEKDDTDMMLAVQEGYHRGYRRFVLYGGIGGRLDHTLANLQVLSWLAGNGARGYLVNGAETVTVIAAGEEQRFSPVHRGILTVLAAGGSAAVDLIGLKYSGKGLTLPQDRPLGVSNEFIGSESAVVARSGRILLIWQRPADVEYWNR